MADDIKLGPSGSEVTLPEIKWLGSSPPNLPVNVDKSISEAKMSDGSRRYAFYAEKKSWILSWEGLTSSELDTLKTLYSYNQVLHFQNNWEDSTWYNVVITSFNYEPIVITYAMGTTKYRATMTLKEV